MKNFLDIKELEDYMNENNIQKLTKIPNIKKFALCTSNFGGMVIISNKTSEVVFVQEIWDTGYKDIKECKIKYSERDCSDEVTPYFEYEEEDYFLNDFLKM